MTPLPAQQDLTAQQSATGQGMEPEGSTTTGATSGEGASTPAAVEARQQGQGAAVSPASPGDTHAVASTSPPAAAEAEARAQAESLIGRRLRVYWPNDRQWFLCTVVAYKPETDRHQLVYDDGDERWTPLHRRDYHVLPTYGPYVLCGVVWCGVVWCGVVCMHAHVCVLLVPMHVYAVLGVRRTNWACCVLTHPLPRRVCACVCVRVCVRACACRSFVSAVASNRSAGLGSREVVGRSLVIQGTDGRRWYQGTVTSCVQHAARGQPAIHTVAFDRGDATAEQLVLNDTEHHFFVDTSRIDLDRTPVLGRRVQVYWRKELRLYEGTISAWEAVPRDLAHKQVSRVATANSRSRPKRGAMKVTAAGERPADMTLENCVINIAYDDGDIYRKYLSYVCVCMCVCVCVCVCWCRMLPAWCWLCSVCCCRCLKQVVLCTARMS